MASQANTVLDKEADTGRINTYLPLVICIVSIIVSVLLFGKNGILTRLATNRLCTKVDKSTASASEIKNLVSLYNFQGQTEAARLLAPQPLQAPQIDLSHKQLEAPQVDQRSDA
jgi:hypothetical protein